ncbi:MAG: transglutaminase-like domain-containing protein [Clostridia bacterium]|nr:transglutaminase-like domain-containing protein [Clostridia bacterium]
MTRKSKIIYIVGSVVIGIASVLIILFGLILGGVITLGDSKLVISSASREFTYNGEEQTDGGWQLVSGKLAKGHTIEASVTGSREDVGSSLNYITVTIVDSNGADVTSDYAIEYRVGTLTVIARPITIKTAEVEKTYDGEELTSPDWEITKGKLVAGQTMSVTMNASITDAGEVENSAEVEIFAGEKDVTSNYAITKDTGVLKVNPIEFHFVTPTLTKTYDGLPLFSAPDSFELISGAPLAGHSVVSMKVVGRITNVGEVENSVEIKIAAANGTDITKNYLAVIDSGTLTVRGIAITISTASGEKVYDGTPLANPEWALNAGTPLLAGHEITQLIMPASQTNAGISPNEISQITIVNSLGEDVTENYEINYSIGSLVVTPRPITVQSGSASKEYDGRPLTCREWKFTSNYLPVSGQSADVAISGSRTEPGQTANTIAQVIISDKNGNDLTGNYDITRDEGVLIVKGEGSPANVGDLDQSGNISGGETGDSDAPETTALGVKTQSGGTVYLRLTSFGNYDGKKWSKAKEYSKTYSGNSFNYLAADSLKNEGYTAENISIAVYGTGYYLPYYMTVNGDYTVQKSDVYNAGNSKNYSLEYYRYNYISNPLEGKLTGSAVSGYTSFVHTNYTAVTSGTKAYLDKIISEQGWKSGDKDLIKKVASYVQNSAEYNLEYDRALDNENDIVLAFLRDYKEGICQHYASAATLLYRQLGLPARYTIGYVADTVADDWVEVKAKNAHAWVEVYIDGFGWVQVEVTGGSSAGGAFEGDGNGNQGGENGENGGEQNGVISVKPVTEYYKYDGRTSFRHSGSLQGLSLHLTGFYLQGGSLRQL